MKNPRIIGKFPILKDKIYLKDKKDEAELEQRYMELDLSLNQRMVINDYIACIRSANNRYCYLHSVNIIRMLRGKESYI